MRTFKKKYVTLQLKNINNMKSTFYAAMTALLTLTACSPRVGTLLTKTYPANGAGLPVSVFMNPSLAPANSESLGVVSITDTGFSTLCDSVTVVELLKEEARKAGGNAVVVTEYIRPSIWRSSCHQMTGTILRVHDFDSFAQAADTDSAQLVTVKVIQPERKLPKITLAADFGYGYRTAPVDPDLSAVEKHYYQGLKSGYVVDAAFKYYFTDYMGAGLIYSAYNASQSMYGVNTDDLIQFVGPVFLTRMPFKDNRWLFNVDLGIGYMGYSEKSSSYSDKIKADGSTLGVYYNLGLEYRLKQNLGIGINMTAFSGVVYNFTKDTNGYKESVDLQKGEGLGQIQLLVGVRYYIK
ncbi:hypothetical protein AGMMS49982_00890 [Bacteroidia bacterium]|nr:hypothetical protein AGMMS49982_00890 [Bacteroidia bacterium]